MTALSNRTAFFPSFDSARDTWKFRANQLCGADAYKDLEATQLDGENPSPPVWIPALGVVSAPSYNAMISGYLLCESSGMTVPEAKEYLRSQQAREQREIVEARIHELDQLGGTDCTKLDPGITGEIYFRRAKALRALERYSEARACFLLTQDIEKDSYYYRESCEALGLMYEVGLGVARDMKIAHEWYLKAGLK